MSVMKLLLQAALLIQASSVLVLAQYPCPNVEDIKPCTCEVLDPLQGLYLDCSKVKDEEDLQRVFNAYFPFHNFQNFTMLANTTEARINITTLTKDTFKNATFANIRISCTTLENIEFDAFYKSMDRLETLIVTDSYLTTFPFDMLVDCPLLTDLRVFRNRIGHMSDLVSDSLTYLQISYNADLQFSDQAFYELPNLEVLILNDINRLHITADTFSSQARLWYLDLSYNNLQVLYNGSLHFHPDAVLQQVKLDANQIFHVEKDAIKGLKEGTMLWMQHNQLTDLPRDSWEHVFKSVTPSESNFVFDDNPIVCECNLLWMVMNDEHMDTLATGARCSNTDSDIHDINKDFLVANCPPLEP